MAPDIRPPSFGPSGRVYDDHSDVVVCGTELPASSSSVTFEASAGDTTPVWGQGVPTVAEPTPAIPHWKSWKADNLWVQVRSTSDRVLVSGLRCAKGSTVAELKEHIRKQCGESSPFHLIHNGRPLQDDEKLSVETDRLTVHLLYRGAPMVASHKELSEAESTRVGRQVSHDDGLMMECTPTFAPRRDLVSLEEPDLVHTEAEAGGVSRSLLQDSSSSSRATASAPNLHRTHNVGENPVNGMWRGWESAGAEWADDEDKEELSNDKHSTLENVRHEFKEELRISNESICSPLRHPQGAEDLVQSDARHSSFSNSGPPPRVAQNGHTSSVAPTPVASAWHNSALITRSLLSSQSAPALPRTHFIQSGNISAVSIPRLSQVERHVPQPIMPSNQPIFQIGQRESLGSSLRYMSPVARLLTPSIPSTPQTIPSTPQEASPRRVVPTTQYARDRSALSPSSPLQPALLPRERLPPRDTASGPVPQPAPAASVASPPVRLRSLAIAHAAGPQLASPSSSVFRSSSSHAVFHQQAAPRQAPVSPQHLGGRVLERESTFPGSRHMSPKASQPPRVGRVLQRESTFPGNRHAFPREATSISQHSAPADIIIGRERPTAFLDGTWELGNGDIAQIDGNKFILRGKELGISFDGRSQVRVEAGGNAMIGELRRDGKLYWNSGRVWTRVPSHRSPQLAKECRVRLQGAIDHYLDIVDVVNGEPQPPSNSEQRTRSGSRKRSHSAFKKAVLMTHNSPLPEVSNTYAPRPRGSGGRPVAGYPPPFS